MTKRRITQRIPREEKVSIKTEGANEGGEMERNYPVAARRGRLPPRKNPAEATGRRRGGNRPS